MVVVVVLVIVVAAAVAAAGLDGIAGSMENSVPVGVVVGALGRCPGVTVLARLVPKALSRADLFASVRGQASEEGTVLLQATVPSSNPRHRVFGRREPSQGDGFHTLVRVPSHAER